jgi:hypothetical protein
MHRLLLLPLLAIALAQPARAGRWSGPEPVGIVTDERLDEISGLAAARRHPGLYWAINDGGNSSDLHLMTAEGEHRGRVAIAGVANLDWEDLASFRLDGKDYLLVADTGDNGGIRQDLLLHVIEEPAALDAPAAVAWTVRFRWPDGPRDCEAVAVDPVSGEVLLISKKRVPPELFRVPLRPPAGDAAPVVAELLGTLPGIAQPEAEDLERSPLYGRYRAQITGATLSPNGRVLAVLSYRSLHFLVRPQRGAWAPALARPRAGLELPFIPQAEAIGFALDGRSLLIGSEQLPSPLWRFRILPDGN